MEKISRRSFFKLAGAAAAAGAAPQALARDEAHAASPPSSAAAGAKLRYTFFKPQEAALVEAMVERLIPNDEMGAGALQAGVPEFIDKQMAGAWGAGERLYRSGPWRTGTPSQGYQLPLTPAELFRNALRSIQQDLARAGHASFAAMPAADQDAYLRQLQEGSKELEGVPGKVFFESLWAMTLEGYFSDPVYGGNVGMASWKMIGFPGAYANYYELVDQHNLSFDQAPISLADTGHGTIHIKPHIPATAPRKGK
jgi:gluconate 2-dehydrogenase gamma chain